MIHSVALVIADFFVSKDVITEEEKEVCAYGMELIIAGIISVALVLIIGLITGNIWYAVVYNIMMIVIRLYTGGYHADTHVGCNVCYCMAFIISMVLLKAQTYIKSDVAIWLVALGLLRGMRGNKRETRRKKTYTSGWDWQDSRSFARDSRR